MNESIGKMIVVGLDGSSRSLGSLDYLKRFFGARHELKVTLLYVLPSLPPILVEESRKNPKVARQVKALEKKNSAVAEEILQKGREKLIESGYDPENIETIQRPRQVGIAQDICHWSQERKTDAVLVSSRGRGRLEAFFLGEVANRMTEFCLNAPVWILKGKAPAAKGVLIGVDPSENAMRAVDHAGFMLSGTDHPMVLFHTKRKLQRFLPREVVEQLPGIDSLWSEKAEEEIAPYMKRAREMLVEHGISADQIESHVVKGTFRPAADILKAADAYKCGTVILGRRGMSNESEFSMGTVARKIVENASNLVLWIAD